MSKDDLAPICGYCGEKSKQVGGLVIYPHRPDLDHKRFYMCTPCNAYVGCHADGRPLGTLADEELREKRKRCHRLFDPLWRDGNMSRTNAYKWLSKELKIHPKDCHIAMFDITTCKRLIALFIDC